jgi:transcriptional regulator with XRE-family HTH domain
VPPKATKRPRDKRLKAVGDRIRAERERLDPRVSQEQFASKLGVHRTYYSGIERGMRNFSLLVFFDIADALGVDARRLLPGRPRPRIAD